MPLLSGYLAMLTNENDRKVFEIIYNEYGELMYHIALGILDDARDAEDVVHQAFVKLLGIVDRIDKPKSHSTRSLVVIITEHLAIDIYRKRKQIALIPFDGRERAQAFSSSDAASYMSNTSPICAAVSRLSDTYRQVLLLKYDSGYSNAEVAKMLNITETNVKKIAQRAKKKLRELLEEEGYNDF